MSITQRYDPDPPKRGEIDAWRGAAVLEFGAPWCGFCRAAQPLVASALGKFPDVRHLKVEDGSGRQLGRSFGVKLWPTLVFLKDGQECARTIRPKSEEEIRRALEAIA